MYAETDAARCAGRRVVFVPTMGFLHEGHLALMHEAKRHGDFLVVSIFVNPAQFGPNEDLEKYPRNLTGDLAMCESAGCGVVYTPTAKSMYDEGFETYVSLSDLPNHLCGLSRPGHFRGVATVVAKLFNTVRPHAAVFGEKDFQQLAVIRRMVKDLDFFIDIVGLPTVREADGLAKSSRNSYLSADERKRAIVLYKSLGFAKEAVDAGEQDAFAIISRETDRILAVKGTEIDYVAICDPDTLEDMNTLDRPAVMALAVKLGNTRLIDNMMLFPKQPV